MHSSCCTKTILKYLGLFLVIAGGLGCFYQAKRHFDWVIIPSDIESTSAGDYLAGYAATANDDFEKAAAHFNKSLAYDASNKILLVDTYTATLLSGQVDEALALAHKYLPKNPASLTGSLIQGLKSIRKEDYAEAERIIKLYAKDHTAIEKLIIPYILNWCQAGQGHTNTAIASLKSMLDKKHEKNAFTDYQLALVHDMAGINDNAEKYYAEAIHNSEKSYRFIKNAGNFYERTGKKEDARVLYTEYNNIEDLTDLFTETLSQLDQRKRAPEKLIKTAKDGIVDVLLEIVGTLYKGQLYREALAYLEMILYLDPENTQAHFLLGAYYEQSAQFEKAIRHFKEVRRSSDFYWQTQINIAQSYYKLNDTKNAKRQLASLYKQRANDFDAPLLLADILRNEEDYLSAMEIYEQLITSIATPLPEHWYIFYMRGINYEQAGMWEKAEGDLRKALELQPEQPDVLNYLGYSLLTRNKDYANAKAMISKALEQRINSPQILDSMGWALYLSNDVKTAIIYLEKALELMPYDSTINDHVGDAYWKMGRKIEARFQWNHALTFLPDPKDVPVIEQKLISGLPDNTAVPILVNEKVTK